MATASGRGLLTFSVHSTVGPINEVDSDVFTLTPAGYHHIASLQVPVTALLVYINQCLYSHAARLASANGSSNPARLPIIGIFATLWVTCRMVILPQCLCHRCGVTFSICWAGVVVELEQKLSCYACMLSMQGMRIVRYGCMHKSSSTQQTLDRYMYVSLHSDVLQMHKICLPYTQQSQCSCSVTIAGYCVQ